MAPGDYHRVVHIWINDGNGRWLIQRRADDVELFPGIWAATGGSVMAGEDSLTGALRETREELGLALRPSELRSAFRQIRADSLVEAWVAGVRDLDAADVAFGPEVAEVRWAFAEEIRAMTGAGEFFDYGEEYLAALGIA